MDIDFFCKEDFINAPSRETALELLAEVKAYETTGVYKRVPIEPHGYKLVRIKTDEKKE